MNTLETRHARFSYVIVITLETDMLGFIRYCDYIRDRVRLGFIPDDKQMPSPVTVTYKDDKMEVSLLEGRGKDGDTRSHNEWGIQRMSIPVL